jgi:hypothetical protein
VSLRWLWKFLIFGCVTSCSLTDIHLRFGGSVASIFTAPVRRRFLPGYSVTFSAPIETPPGAHPAPYTVVSFPGVKRPEHGVNHPSPSSAEVKERVELYFCLLLCAFMAGCSVNFTVLLNCGISQKINVSGALLMETIDELRAVHRYFSFRHFLQLRRVSALHLAPSSGRFGVLSWCTMDFGYQLSGM